MFILLSADGYESHLRSGNPPKRQAGGLHPKLAAAQRPDFDDVHRPSMNIKTLIKPVDINEELSDRSRPHSTAPSKFEVKSLPAIARYEDRERVYRPTFAYERPSECPYIPRRPAHECYNAPPYECANAGYADSRTCPLGTICCYDGCINLCWSPTAVGNGGPTPPPILPPFAPPPSEQQQLRPDPPPPPPARMQPTTPSSERFPQLTEEPLFYHPAPQDFRASVGPPPLVEGPLLSPADIVSDYHVETNPFKAPPPPQPSSPLSAFLPSTTPAPPPPPPPREQFAPPLDNRDALPAAPPLRHPEAKSLGRG